MKNNNFDEINKSLRGLAGILGILGICIAQDYILLLFTIREDFPEDFKEMLIQKDFDIEGLGLND